MDTVDTRYGLLAVYIGGPVAQATWLGIKVGSDMLYSSHEPSKLLQWLCRNDSTINIILVIITTTIMITTDCKCMHMLLYSYPD